MPMAAGRLRVYFGPESESVATAVSPLKPVDDTVTVPLGEVLPLLVDAFDSRRMWLADFDDDDITISSDLYEVLLAYQHYRRPSA
jgi:hypothetical protein